MGMPLRTTQKAKLEAQYENRVRDFDCDMEVDNSTKLMVEVLFE